MKKAFNGGRLPQKRPEVRNNSVIWTLVLGLVFHLIYIYSVVDCYFTSPVVHGMRHFSTGKATAQRLVLIVGDGLRADLLFNLHPFPSVLDSPRIVAPYLRNIVEERGAFGVSHTHVPTESRPGHVAIIGGMYEDVSAVTKGWKSNPVDFDSVFNQSRHTFSFGSPDILPIFSHGAPSNKIETWMYNEEDEDFTKDATELDTWVLDHVKELFQNASADPLLDRDLRGEHTVFFLHLLGLDTTGHSYRPHSKEYMQNIQVVDDIVKQTESLFKRFFQDDKTAYVFTADHGMSNIGNHGDGNPDSTRTPLIAWGAGIRGPLRDSNASTHDEYSIPWGLEHLVRRDVEQADIAPLMSTILGLDIPVNSVGVLPDVDADRPGYLAPVEGDKDIALAAVANAKSILEHYRVKHRRKKARKMFFTPFDALATRSPSGSPGSGHLLRVHHLIDTQQWSEVRKAASELINISLEGIRYLDTYDRTMLQFIVAFGYVGWAAYSASTLLLGAQSSLKSSHHSKARRAIINLSAFAIFASLSSLFIFQQEPWTYYFYLAFPCYFWSEVAIISFGYKDTLDDRREESRSDEVGDSKRSGVQNSVTLQIIFAIISLQAMVLAYKQRWIWSVGLLAMGILWPIVSWPQEMKTRSRLLVLKWTIACLTCAVFPLRDVEQGESLTVIVLGGILMIFAGSVLMSRFKDEGSTCKKYTKLQICVTVVSLAFTYHSVYRLSNKLGLPVSNQIAGWNIFVASALLPLTFPFKSFSREMKLLTIFMAFAPCFIILSICAEGLFYVAYCATLWTWIEVEYALRTAVQDKSLDSSGKHNDDTEHDAIVDTYRLRPDDVRTALFFLFFVQIAFFGTGNVASISSFYLEPVYRLVPVFNPFVMAALLLFKIFAPYVFLSAAFATLTINLRIPPYSLFLIALSLTDVMTLSFFLNVTDSGSWLEIGQTISFFIIASLLLLWSAGVCALGNWLMREHISIPKTKHA